MTIGVGKKTSAGPDARTGSRAGRKPSASLKTCGKPGVGSEASDGVFARAVLDPKPCSGELSSSWLLGIADSYGGLWQLQSGVTVLIEFFLTF